MTRWLWLVRFAFWYWVLGEVALKDGWQVGKSYYDDAHYKGDIDDGTLTPREAVESDMSYWES